MKLSVTVFLGLMLVLLAVTVSGKAATYLVETPDDRDASVTNCGIFITIKYNLLFLIKVEINIYFKFYHFLLLFPTFWTFSIGTHIITYSSMMNIGLETQKKLTTKVPIAAVAHGGVWTVALVQSHIIDIEVLATLVLPGTNNSF